MEILECPITEHAGSVVVRDGWYGKPGHRRQRWRCRPSNGDPKHRFTPVLTRQGEPHPYCVECSTGLEPWEGQAGAREYRFAAREVGEALVSVAKGTTYRAAAEVARRNAGRVPTSDQDRRRRSPANEGQLVANWVDVCAGFVCAGELPDRWPHTLAVDSQNFRVNSGPRDGSGFHVLAAVGRDKGDAARWAPIPRVWRLEPFARKDQAAWEAFFEALDGAPRVIVSDADNALALAIRSVFGEAVEHRLCEWHLERKLRYHLPEHVLADRGHPITCALRGAFHTTDAWTQLEEAIREHEDGPLILAVKWLDTYGRIAKAQIPTRDPHGINSTGPVADPPRNRPADRRSRRLVHQPDPPLQIASPDDPGPARQSRRTRVGRPPP